MLVTRRANVAVSAPDKGVRVPSGTVKERYSNINQKARLFFRLPNIYGEYSQSIGTSSVILTKNT